MSKSTIDLILRIIREAPICGFETVNGVTDALMKRDALIRHIEEKVKEKTDGLVG